jgi:quercetin dioxygenase-like cupin family protein
MSSTTSPQPATPLPPDDPHRTLTLAQADPEPLHMGIVGDTYTILLSGEATAGRFTLIDMHIPPGGGPPPHRHDFEESFTILEGELEATFRGKKSTVKAGETISIPANAPHQFHNASTQPVRLLCICSPAGQENFFRELGVPVATRTTPPPKLNPDEQATFLAKAQSLAAKYRTELLRQA